MTMHRKKRGKYTPEKLKVDVTCLQCSKEFKANRRNRKFCSNLCVQRHRIPPIGRKKGNYIKCLQCNKDTYVKPCFKGKKKFCSKECHLKNMKDNAFNFPCLICQKPIFIQPAQLKYRARSTCSPDCRKKLVKQRTEKRRLENGITKHQLDRAERYSVEATEWRKSVFERDDYTCQFCGVRGSYLEADHIKPWAYFPKLRFDLSNGRTLCKPCHNTTKISYHKMRKLYGKVD